MFALSMVGAYVVGLWPGAGGMALGYFATCLHLWMIKAGLKLATLTKENHVAQTVGALLLLGNIPAWIGLGVLAGFLGRPVLLPFLMGVFLVYCWLTGWGFAKSQDL